MWKLPPGEKKLKQIDRGHIQIRGSSVIKQTHYSTINKIFHSNSSQSKQQIHNPIQSKSGRGIIRNKINKTYLESATKQILQGLRGIFRRIYRWERDAQSNKSLDSIGPEQSEGPGDDSPPIVADQENAIDGEMVEKADEVADDVEEGVGEGACGRIGVAIATEVGGDGAEP